MSRPKLVMTAGAALIVVLLVIAGVLFYKYSTLKKDPQTVAQETSKQVIKEVGQLYKLPQNETPTVARVEDKKKLSGQPFFKDAENGDYILVYTNSKLAILYRQPQNLLINVAPVSLDDNQANRPAVKVLNGSGGTERLEAAKAKLQELSSQINYDGSAADAANKNTTQTTVVDVSGQNPTLAALVAQKLGGSVASSLPSGESAPAGAQIVVIIGKN